MLRTTSPFGVAPPVSDDCAPIGNTFVAARTMSAISEVARGTAIPAACPPGKCAASERYFGSVSYYSPPGPPGQPGFLRIVGAGVVLGGGSTV